MDGKQGIDRAQPRIDQGLLHIIDFQEGETAAGKAGLGLFQGGLQGRDHRLFQGRQFASRCLTAQDQGLDLPLDDPAVYQLFSDGNTTAVFQSESRSAKDLEKKLKPDNFEDIIALMALNRPGPLGSGMVDDFIARKKETSKTGKGRAEW